jgi:hypothetical protein
VADTKTTLTWLLHDQVSGTAAKIEGNLQKVGKAGAKSGPIGMLGGAIGGLISPLGLATAGVGILTAGLGMALGAAKDHEVVLARLDQTLQSNVKGYDGNRAAIDQYIEKQTNAGFTVDETTASLAQLVTATGSVQKAQEFQAAAMDLARLKGISLQDATDAMTKIEAGRFRGLANLGIVLQKGATVTDALTAVQKVAAGQSDAYGKTVQGAFSKMNAKFGDAMTKIGEGLMPVLAGLASFFADVLLPALGKVLDFIGPWVGRIVSVFSGMASAIIGIWNGITTTIKNVIDAIIDIINGAIRGINRIQVHIHVGPVGYDFNGLNLHQIPRLHSGGIVPGPMGSDQLTMLQAGERVLPRNESSSGVYIQGISEREIVDMVDRGLYFRLQRAAPTLGRT